MKTTSVAIAVMIWALYMTTSTAVNGGEMTDFVFIFKSAESTTAGGKETTSYVGPQKTIVESPGSLLIIDYRQQLVVEYLSSTGRCDTYPLLNEKSSEKGLSKDEQLRQEMAWQLGMAEVEQEAARFQNNGLRQVAISWGGPVNLHRTVTPPSVVMYGRSFTAGRDLYLVEESYDGLHLLLEYGKMRDSVFRRNPLLRRLDICGQVSLIAGIPLQKTHGNGGVEKFQKMRKGSVDSYPPVPGACP